MTRSWDARNHRAFQIFAWDLPAKTRMTMSEWFTIHHRPKHPMLLIYLKHIVDVHICCVTYGQRTTNSSWKSWTYCTRCMSYNSLASPGNAPSNTQEHSGCHEHKGSLAPPETPGAPHTPNYQDWGKSQKHLKHFRHRAFLNKPKNSFSKISEKCRCLNSLTAWRGRVKHQQRRGGAFSPASAGIPFSSHTCR